ncbi:MAG: 3-dehydro-scyllo-inosose hydrolase [Sedimentisphaerales bacterium]|nr:3-dehydro-scyllo-inosose hydrolase [Sedimentisphaerales bacterium]
MSKNAKLLSTNQPDLFFENSAVGKMKKQIWEASDKEVDKMLAEYGVPSPPEWCKPGSYIQTTVRYEQEKRRKKNDIVLIPIGCTENHGQHTVSAMDTFFVTGICEGVRRYTEKRGAPVSVALPPLMYGCHPYHHIGMPGTVIIRENVAKEFIMDVMLGLYNDGFRKQILVNNHGHLWMLEASIQQFCKRYQLPGLFRVMDWHRATREFWRTKDQGGKFETPFIHADEAETSVGLLLFPDMVEMSKAEEAEPEMLMPGGHMDTSVDTYGRPSRWSECEGHAANEIAGTPEGVVGKPGLGEANKAKKPVLAIMKYLTLLIDETLEAFPAGTVPPTEKVSLRDPKELAPYLKEPMSKGWKSVYSLPQVGPF